MAKTTMRSAQLEPIDRLEEKLKLLVDMVERMKAEQARATDENARLTRELKATREQLAARESVNSELDMLREERDLIRSRVGDLLGQLEALNL